MRWLLWKDYRQYRPIVFTALCLLVVPHLIVLIAVCKYGLTGHREFSHWAEYFAVSSVYGLALCLVSVALFGGNVIASERADRSAEFLFSLPCTRRRLLASKLLLALAVVATPWLVDGLIFSCVAVTTDLLETRRVDQSVVIILANLAVAGVAIFSVAWCLSSLIASPALAVCGGLVAPLFVIAGVYFVDYVFALKIEDPDVLTWWQGICLALSPPCFALGVWLYLRRIEP